MLTLHRRAKFGVAALLGVLLAPGAQAAHPLITEDTATQGAGRLQFEINTEHAELRDNGSEEHTVLTNAVLAYGFTETADAILTLPYLRLDQLAGGGTGQAGLADVGLDVKWRFYETGPLSVAFKPGVTFPTGDETRNLGSGEVTWSAYLVSTYNAAPWSVHLHLGHLHHNNTFNERVNIWHASTGVIRQFGETFKLIVDLGIDTNTARDADWDPAFLITGFIWSPRPDIDVDLGVKFERSDGASAHALLAGLTARW
jgi:Putative MetA-pathway of phenol degradation